MIYVSSSCIKAQYIKQSVKTLAESGFDCIELSGGSEYYPQILEDLLELKEKYNLQFACHNYFPPPKNGDFVINLASLDSAVFERSLEICIQLWSIVISLEVLILAFTLDSFCHYIQMNWVLWS